MKEDSQLLADFCRNESESAFAELVSRYLDLVYSTALRIVGGDCALAEDVSQSVFLHLARRAASLNPEVRLGGWIHRHTCFTAAKLIRTERRRKRRECIALELQENQEKGRSSWEQIAPHLDECLAELRSADRESLILRFLNRRDLREVGKALGVSEDAAQKRVSRALERLRNILERRGLSIGGLSSLLVAHAVTVAPLRLGATVVSHSLGGNAVLVTLRSLLDLVPMTKLNLSVLSVVIAGTVAPLLVHHYYEVQFQAQEAALHRQTARLKSVSLFPPAPDRPLARVRLPLSAEERSELMRLRGDVGRMRRHLVALETSLSLPPSPRNRHEVLAAMTQHYESRVLALKDRFVSHPAESVPELQLLSDVDWLFLAGEQSGLDEQARQRLMSKARTMAESEFGNRFLKPALDQFASDHPGVFPAAITQLVDYLPETIPAGILDRWKVIQTSQFAPILRRQVDEDDWVITQRSPINASLDQRYVLGLQGRHLFSDGPKEFWNDRHREGR